MKNICIIPARGGSKRIPRKNIKPFMGKPIIAYSIEATAPFVTPERLREAYGKMNSEIDSVFTCVAYSYPIQRSLHIVDGRIGMVYPEYMNARSQDLEPIYHDAGQFYFSRTAPFVESRTFWGKNTAGLVLSELEVQDLDTLTDWTLAEMKYELLHR